MPVILTRRGRTLKIAEEELSRASEITTQGLQFHRQPAGPVSMNVVEILESVLALFKGKFKASRVGIELRKEDSLNSCVLPGDAPGVCEPDRQCCGGDARWWPAEDPGASGNGVAQRKSRARITIADTGSGMSIETHKRMYEAFYTTKGPAGSGLGLWVTANIVRKHRGYIHVRSKRSKGTVFTLIFPYAGAAGKNAGFQEHAA